MEEFKNQNGYISNSRQVEDVIMQIEEKIQNNKEWHEIFSEFFIKIRMNETNMMFTTELLVFSSDLEKLLMKNIDWLIQELNCKNVNSTIKRKKEDEDFSNANKIQRLIKPQDVRTTSKETNPEIEKRIESFIQFKKPDMNDPSDQNNSTSSDNFNISSDAKTDDTAVEINRNEFGVVNNNDNDDGVEERLQNIEKHLNKRPIVKSVPHDVYERLKVLEDKIMKSLPIISSSPQSIISLNENIEPTLPKMKMEIDPGVLGGISINNHKDDNNDDKIVESNDVWM
ncbi:16984_t:CDS:10 [Entrophospora sp. SA101]|nr:16984_t:CDS:10 [Entrophospora sp. SA101]